MSVSRLLSEALQMGSHAAPGPPLSRCELTIVELGDGGGALGRCGVRLWQDSNCSCCVITRAKCACVRVDAKHAAKCDGGSAP